MSKLFHRILAFCTALTVVRGAVTSTSNDTSALEAGAPNGFPQLTPLITKYCDGKQVRQINDAWYFANLVLLRGYYSAKKEPVYDVFYGGSYFTRQLFEGLYTQIALQHPAPVYKQGGDVPVVHCAPTTVKNFVYRYRNIDQALATECVDQAAPRKSFNGAPNSEYHNFLFVCGDKFFGSPTTPQQYFCPAVERNVFSEQGAFTQAQSDLLITGMISIYTEISVAVDINLFYYLNQAVARRYTPSALSFGVYVYFIDNKCADIPDITEAPWVGEQIAQNSTSEAPSKVLADLMAQNVVPPAKDAVE